MYENGVRKMAWIAKIASVSMIEGADKIVSYGIGGWNVVDQKDKYLVGDLVVYVSIDSWIPTNVAPFLTKPGHFPKTYNGVEGEKLRTIKLRGTLSQGLLLPVSVVPPGVEEIIEGDDVSDALGIQKYEPPIPAQLTGLVKGNFPSLIPKTDQERIQNIKKEIAEAVRQGFEFEVTEKLEGSSMTCYLIRGEFGVCSRNLDLKRDENNTFWKVAIEEDIEREMRAIDEHWDFAIQGELVGPGVQGNIYKLNKHRFFVFDVYDGMTGKYLNPQQRRDLVTRMGLDHVPHLLTTTLPDVGMEQLISYADGMSVLGDITGPLREGLVYKQVDGGMTFKIISNKFLLGQKD